MWCCSLAHAASGRTDALLAEPGSEYGTLLPNTEQNLQIYADSFTPSQEADFQWLTGNLVWRQALGCNHGAGRDRKSICCECCSCSLQKEWSRHSPPSGVAAHLIEGVTIHHFFNLNIHLNCNLQHSTAQTTRQCNTNVLVVNELSMLNATLFRTMEGLCRCYARKGSSKHHWGGRYVIMPGDPAQLPAV